MSIFRQKWYLFLSLLFLLFCGTGIAAAETILISVIDSPPYFIAGTVKGDHQGLAVDLSAEAWKAAGLDAEFTFIPMVRAVWSLLDKQYDALLGTPEWFTGQKEADLIETVDIVDIPFVFFYRKDRFPGGLDYRHLDELRPYKIGNVRGSSTLALLEKEGLELELVTEVEQNYRKLQSGRLDLVAGVELSGWILINELYPDSADEFATIDKPFFTARVSMILLKEDAELLELFRDGLEEIIQNGLYREIFKYYYDRDKIPDGEIMQSPHERAVILD